MNSWLELLYPDLQVTDANLVGQNAEPTSAPMIAPLQEVNNGFHFGGGGINYSAPMGDGQFNGQLKGSGLNLNWLDQLNRLNFHAGHGNVGIDYSRSF
ncbi:MAG TPA: hypothetical protein VMW50_00535 [Dehalococcoidia bacterium]|nr:hypothetical protein [Dehalococcoidia bacterium]